MKSRFAMLATAAAAMAWMSGAAVAQKAYTYGQWLPPKHNINLKALKPMIEELGKDVPWRLVTGGQLFSAKSSLKSIGNRTAEAGLIVPSYTRSNLKHAYIIADMLMLGKSELVMNAAGLNTLFFDCPECLGDYDKAGTIYLSGYGVGGYSLLCRKMVKSFADAKGLKLRTTGALGRWARAIGGTPISMTMGDVPEAIKRGQIDCIIGPIAWLKSYPIADAVKSIYNYSLGSYSTVGLVVMNRAAWDSYSDAQKRKMWDVQPGAIARGMIDGYLGDDLTSRAMAKKLGIPITPAGPDVAPLWEKHKKNEVATVLKNAKKLGVKNPEKIVNAMIKNIDKWTKIIAASGLSDTIAQAGLDKDALGPATEKYRKLLVEHIYSKIDPLKL
jgi:TRAP-type C4-dicarboxylate transport system substrate-binding protein